MPFNLITIKRQLKAKSWTQQDLAAAVQVNPVYLTRLFHGEYTPKMTIVAAIAHALNASLDDVWRYSEHDEKIRLAQAARRREIGKQVWTHVKNKEKTNGTCKLSDSKGDRQ